MPSTAPDITSPGIDERSLTIKDFCHLEDISAASYYKLRKAGHGPREYRLPGSTLVRISPEARREWHQRLQEIAASEPMEQEREARVKQAQKAGRAGASSPEHPCRRRATAKRIRGA